MELNDNQYTLLGIIIGGVGLKIVDYFVQKRKAKSDKVEELARLLEERDAESKRELREDIDKLRERQDDLARELDEWKEKYWNKVQELNSMQAENARLLLQAVERNNNA